ncbi:MAG: hypothetical protein KGI49_03050 [Patescibacteria group bacterium]|nr:hypothetical protein [Patescibacteria group bacterium]
MNEKDINPQPQFNDPMNWKSLGFFSAEDYLLYVFKKTEKITAALYLVSGLLKDQEPLKWELRDKGMDLIASSFTASSTMPGDKSAVIQSLFTSALETISILNVAKISNLVSDMNYKILVREIDGILGILKDRLAQSAEKAGYVLSDDFFKTPNLIGSGSRTDTGMTDKGHANQTVNRRLAADNIRSHSDTVEKKNKRQESIIAVLRTQSHLTIRDFTKVIKDVSAKTIQRELLELTAKGVIRKEGERRWSRYSLNS